MTMQAPKRQIGFVLLEGDAPQIKRGDGVFLIGIERLLKNGFGFSVVFRLELFDGSVKIGLGDGGHSQQHQRGERQSEWFELRQFHFHSPRKMWCGYFTRTSFLGVVRIKYPHHISLFQGDAQRHGKLLFGFSLEAQPIFDLTWERSP